MSTSIKSIAEAHIKIIDLVKSYSTSTGEVKAVDGINLEIPHGEFLSIVGPSGCGKTTLLRILAGLIQATSGSALIDGKAVANGASNIGIVFQRPVLLPWRSIIDNVLLPIELHGKITSTHRTKANDLLRLVGLEEFDKKFPHELSGGMQQRAAICRALVHDPSVLLMDEPFGALDAMSRDQLNVELNRIWVETGKTVILITHSIPEAVFLSQRVVVMSARPGKIIETCQIPFGHNRNIDLLGAPEFAKLAAYIRKFFERKKI